MADKINWEDIKTEYLTSDISCASLAKKYGLHHSSVCRKVKRDNWDEEKAHMSEEKRKVVQEKTIEAQVSIADKCLNILNIMIGKVTEAAESVSADDIKAQKDIMSMVKDLHEMGAFELQSNTDNSNTLVVKFENYTTDYEV